MRKLLAATVVAIFVCPGVALADSLDTQASHLRSKVVAKFGKRAPGRDIVRWGDSKGKRATRSEVRAYVGVLHRMLAPPPPIVHTEATATIPTTNVPSAPTYSTSGSYSDVPGVPASFAACVALRESTNGAGSSNIYGILGPGGQGTVAQQKQAFSQMYASRGTQPWAPYDGC